MGLEIGGTLVLVGGGKMGGAMLQGWLARGLDPATIVIQDPAPSAELLAMLDGTKARCVSALPADLRDVAVMLLAVKPQIMEAVLPSVVHAAGPSTVVLSIAAGRTIASFEQHFAPGTAVVRSIPNTPAAVGRGITAACPNAAVTPAQRDKCEQLLEAIGDVVWVSDEQLIDPITAVSGSGPAYVFLLAECLAEAGVAAGLDRDLAMKLACATVSGAGELMRQSEQGPADLRRNVTSPKGTTAAALDVLMAHDGVEALMLRAVAAASRRSRELSS